MSRNKKRRSSFDIVTKAINNKRLLTEIRGFVETLPMANWEHNVMFLEMFMYDLIEDKHIEQFKVICDNRNNTIKDAENDIIHLDITYRQTNCLNVSKISYTFHI